MVGIDAYSALDEGFRRWGPVPDAELAMAHAIFRPHRVPTRTLLQHAGAPAERVSFIVRGLTRMFYVGEGGVERTKGFRAEGELVCSYAAALRNKPSQLFIETLEPAELLTADRPAFVRLCAGHPAWAAVLGAMTERLFLDEERRHRQLLTEDATTRYRAFVAGQPALAARLTQRQIAAYVGVSAEALSRIRTALAVR
ncbi:Crp/Fnr family transcriptional regulator [Actinoplanes sp. KI2]|uniref:Crp/Fnr family transcriptional regulator n=1 Tax=Actinoplanes sp. KI2 TaxID=2983315 RepID=UPI0021D5C47C|nr:Crp/Fnr family transcriptional regulator [Actinoplanes sp. KI2]MCU7724921.1 Crp/Fnr family transcriptional regulator [Actinoplanes sp. KI2]